MKKLILIVRDYGYLQWLRANHDHEEALQKGNELAVTLLTMSWSLPTLAFFAITVNRLGYGSSAHQLRGLIDQNALLKILLGLFLFAPFYWLARRSVHALNDTPIEPKMPYRWLMIISWSMLLIALSLTVLIPLLIQELFTR